MKKRTTSGIMATTRRKTTTTMWNAVVLLFIVHITSNCLAAIHSDESTEYSIVSKSSSISTSSVTSSVSSSSSTNSQRKHPHPSSTTSSTTTRSSTTKKLYTPATQIPKLSKRIGGALSPSSAQSSSAEIQSSSSNTKIKKSAYPSKDSKHHKAPAHQNHTREALSHEGNDRESIVYIPESSGYVPVTSFRGGRPPPPATASGSSGPSGSSSISASGTGSGSYHSGGYQEIENWRPDAWDRDYNKRLRYNNTRVQHIEAECQDDYMKIRIGFNGSFAGLLYSAGYAYDPDCMYINGSGRDYYEFYIQLNRCGTLGKNALHDDNRKNPTNFMWNTVTVQYNPLIEEEYDEHFKVTCEYGYDFWKTVTFPFLDVEVATGNPVVFTLSPPECYMEIRNGYGIAGNRVTGPVRVGDPLTLIIYMRSKYDGFDIVVNDCYAHNGANKKIQLIDEYGCPVDDKLISRFRGSWSDSGVYETQVFAYMKTFRFTGSPALYIECDVRMCHGRCPSQPCHWRNLKTVTKREISNDTLREVLGDDDEDPKKDNPLSENVNLFQALRVLQDGEGDDEDTTYTQSQYAVNETCIKTSVLSIITAGFSLILCMLLAALMIVCAKLRYRKKDPIYSNYVTHKGQID